jgi:hypothetical protein
LADSEDAGGVVHYPGWSLSALKFLYEQRKMTAHLRIQPDR